MFVRIHSEFLRKIMKLIFVYRYQTISESQKLIYPLERNTRICNVSHLTFYLLLQMLRTLFLRVCCITLILHRICEINVIATATAAAVHFSGQ